jgi:hypothetical protein
MMAKISITNPAMIRIGAMVSLLVLKISGSKTLGSFEPPPDIKKYPPAIKRIPAIIRM